MPAQGPTQPPVDYYRAIGLNPQAPPHELAVQLQQRIAATPPGSDREYLQHALAILGDPEKRRIYDARLWNPQAPAWTQPELHQLVSSSAGLPQHFEPPARPNPPRSTGTPRRRGRPLLFGGAAAVLAVVLIIGFVAVSGRGMTSAGCADIVMIGAAGSSQREDVTEYDGVGDIVHKTYTNLRADAAEMGMTAELRAVEYPASPVPFMDIAFSVKDALFGAPSNWDSIGEYMESVDAGVESATSEISRALSECGESKIVVAGYSQGAMVIHRALHRVGPSEEIAVGLLIGDGDRLPNADDQNVDTYHFDDTPKVSRGIAQYSQFLPFTDASQEPFPAAWKGRLISLCSDGDSVCAFTPFSFNEIDELRAHVEYDAETWREYVNDRIAD